MGQKNVGGSPRIPKKFVENPYQDFSILKSFNFHNKVTINDLCLSGYSQFIFLAFLSL